MFGWPRHKQYERLTSFTVDELLNSIGPSQYYDLTPTIRIGLSSDRLQTFKSSPVCVKCGMKGQLFALEAHRKNYRSTDLHFNLYGFDTNKTEVLFTKDHIIPRSRGGNEELINLQTMCERCNCNKGNNLRDIKAEDIIVERLHDKYKNKDRKIRQLLVQRAMADQLAAMDKEQREAEKTKRRLEKAATAEIVAVRRKAAKKRKRLRYKARKRAKKELEKAAKDATIAA